MIPAVHVSPETDRGDDVGYTSANDIDIDSQPVVSIFSAEKYRTNLLSTDGSFFLESDRNSIIPTAELDEVQACRRQYRHKKWNQDFRGPR